MSSSRLHKKFQVLKVKEEDGVVLALLISPASQSSKSATSVVRCTCHNLTGHFL